MLFKTSSEKIVILGLNEISLFLAKKLSINKDIIILYENENFQDYRIEETDIITQKIDFNIYQELTKLNDRENIIFISMTTDEIFNIFAARIAAEFNFKMIISLVYTNEYSQINYDFDLIINPHQLIINYILTSIRETRLLNIKRLIPGQINISKIKVKNDDSFVNTKIKNINLKKSLILAVIRKNKIHMATPELELYPGDYIYWLYKKGISDWLRFFNPRYYKKNKIFIFGGKKLCYKLVNEIQNIFEPIVIIEPELKTCNFLASKMEKPLILHGEGTEYNLFKEEGMNDQSIFIALSHSDSQNILSSFGAENLSCKTVLTLINKYHHKKIANLLDINKTIFIPELISNFINKYFNNNIKLNKLEKDIFISKINLSQNLLILNKKIKNIGLSPGILVGVIVRNNKIIIPAGNNTLQAEDTVFVFFKKEKETEVKNKFRSNRI
ncbi:MAG: TrkA C-terminal domain-containing protein [bacterium]